MSTSRSSAAPVTAAAMSSVAWVTSSPALMSPPRSSQSKTTLLSPVMPATKISMGSTAASFAFRASSSAASAAAARVVRIMLSTIAAMPHGRSSHTCLTGRSSHTCLTGRSSHTCLPRVLQRAQLAPCQKHATRFSGASATYQQNHGSAASNACGVPHQLQVRRCCREISTGLSEVRCLDLVRPRGKTHVTLGGRGRRGWPA